MCGERHWCFVATEYPPLGRLNHHNRSFFNSNLPDAAPWTRFSLWNCIHSHFFDVAHEKLSWKNYEHMNLLWKTMKNKIKSLPRKSRAVIALCESPNALMWNSLLQDGVGNCTSKAPSKYTVWSVSFTGEFSPNFDLKNMISTYTKDFWWKK